MIITVTKCPEDELIADYRANVKDKLTVEDMTADQVWVHCHIKECDECRAEVEN